MARQPLFGRRFDRGRQQLMNNPQYRMALQAQQRGMSTDPVSSPWEGLARALQAPLGAVMAGQEERAMRERQGERNQQLVDTIIGDRGMTGGVEPGTGQRAQSPQRQQLESRLMGLMESGVVQPSDLSGVMLEQLGLTTGPEMEPTSVQRDAMFMFPNDPQAQRQYVNKRTTMSKAPSVSVAMPPQESAYAKTRGEAYATRANEIQSEAREAAAQLSQIGSLKNLLSNPSVYQGTGGEAINSLKRLGQTAFGLDMEGVGPAEAAQTIGSRMAINMSSELPGRLSDKDMEILQNIPPSLSRSAEGNQLIADYFERVNRRKLEVAEMANQYERQRGSLDAGFDQIVNQYNRENPLFTDQDLQQMQRTAQGTPQPSPAAGFSEDVLDVIEEYGE